MRVLFDTNVVLDVLLDRAPFRETSAQVVARVERNELTGILGATTLTTIYYLMTKASGRETARSAVRDLLALFQVAAVDRRVLAAAVESPLKDLQDAVLVEAGRLESVDAVVTRDPEDFRDGGLPIFSPQELNAALSS
jgi:predicted nucleic acid-binding protein